MKTRNTLSVLIVLYGAFFTATSSYAMDLHEALSIAYQNNSSLKAERANLRSIDENLPQAYAGWMPTVTGTYSRTRENEQFETAESTNTPHSKTLNLSQNIFNGGQSWYGVTQAKNRIYAARERLRQTEQLVLNQAVIAYIDLVRAKDVLDLSRNNEKVLAEQLEATEDKFELGESTRTDVAQAKSRLARAESDRIIAEGDLIAAESEYRRVYESEPPEQLTMPHSLPMLPDNFDETLQQSLANNPLYLAANYDYEVADAGIDVARASIIPDIDVTGEIRRDGGGGIRRGDSLETESVTMTLRVPLYQSGAEYSRIRQSKETAARARHTLDEVYNSTVDNATKAWKDIQTSRSNIKANQVNVEAAMLALEGVKEEQEFGSRTVLDVLDAEQELFVAQVNLVTAKRNEVVATYNLLASLGELTAEGLNLPIEFYDPKEHYDDVKYQVIGY